MNILTEQQAAARELHLAPQGLLDGCSPDFVAALQEVGMFVEYNEQLIVSAGEPADYLFCVVEGQADISRSDGQFGRVHVATLAPGQWFGEITLFLDLPAAEEVRAKGELVVWCVSFDILRNLFFERPEAVQLLYNFAVLLAQKIALKSESAVPASTAGS